MDCVTVQSNYFYSRTVGQIYDEQELNKMLQMQLHRVKPPYRAL